MNDTWEFFVLFFSKKIIIGVCLIYNIVLISGVQSESVLHTNISTHFYIIFPYWPLQNIRASCAIQQVLISYQFYIQWYICINPNLPSYTSTLLLPGNCKFVFYISNSVFVLYISSFVPFSQIPHMSVTMIFVFVSLTISRSI